MADRFHRRSIRLRGYDHTRAGAYYVTICTHARAHLFGEVVHGGMRTNTMGAVVQRCWDAIPEHMPMVVCDAFVVMPDHVHGIIVITDVGTVGAAAPPPLRDPFRTITPYRPAPQTMTDRHHAQKFIGPHHANVQGRRFTAGRTRWVDPARNAHLATRVLRTHHPR